MALANPCTKHTEEGSTGANVLHLAPAASGWEVAIAGEDGARSFPVAAWATVRATQGCGCALDYILPVVPASTGGLRVVDESESHVVVPPGWRAELKDRELVVVPIVVDAGARVGRARR